MHGRRNSGSRVALFTLRPSPFGARVCAALDADRLRVRGHLRVTGKRAIWLALETFELGKRRIGCAGALVPRLAQRIELALDEDDDVLSPWRTGGGGISQAIAKTAHVAVSEPDRLELGLGDEGIADVVRVVEVV